MYDSSVLFKVLNFVSVHIDVVILLLQGFCLQYFYGSFLERRWPDRWWSKVGVALLYMLPIYVDWLPKPDYGVLRAFLSLLLVLGVSVILVLTFYKGAPAMKGFLVITFVAVREISLLCAYTLLVVGIRTIYLWGWCFDRGYVTLEEFMGLISLTEAGGMILYGILMTSLQYLSLRGIVRSFREKNYVIRWTEEMFLLAPGVTGLLICLLLRGIMITEENQTLELLYERHPLLILVVPVILLLSLLSIWFSVKLFQELIDRNRERNGRIILEKQLDGMKEQLTEMERLYSGIRSIRHDMKNTISVAMQLSAGEGKEGSMELPDYLAELNRTLDQLELRFRTGNTVVDTLLNMKYQEALRVVPELQMDMEGLIFPQNMDIQSYDICVILGNALDNALEACKKLKEEEPEAEAFIRVSSFQRGRFLFIEVENSFDGKVTRRREEEFPVTHKADKRQHGIGLANIKSTAEKYHGAVDWSVEGRVFTLSVMMKNGNG